MTPHRAAPALVAGVAVVVLAGAAIGAYALTRGGGPATRAATLATVDTGDVTVEVATTGTLQPAQARSLGFASAGAVTAVKVAAGTAVRAGEVLATVDRTTATDRVDAAQDAVDAARQAVDASTADATTDQGTNACATASDGAGRYVPVAAPGPTPTPSPAPTPTRPTAPATRSPATHVPAAQPSRSAGNQCTGRTGGGIGTDPVLRAQQQLDAAELALAQAQDALAGTTITAPIAGTVLSVAGAVGTQVGAGNTFITLADVAGMQVAASFPEADAYRLADDLAATVTLADRPGEQLAAKVTRVDPQGVTTGSLVTYGVLLSFDSVPAGLLVGQTAAVRVAVRQASGVLRVPSTAVHGTGGTGTVLVRAADGADRRVPVGVGLRGDTYTQVTSGLAAGDRVARAW